MHTCSFDLSEAAGPWVVHWAVVVDSWRSSMYRPKTGLCSSHRPRRSPHLSACHVSACLHSVWVETTHHHPCCERTREVGEWSRSNRCRGLPVRLRANVSGTLFFGRHANWAAAHKKDGPTIQRHCCSSYTVSKNQHCWARSSPQRDWHPLPN